VPRHDEDFDEDDDYDAEEDDGEDDTVECPYCGAAIYEDTVRCPRCENYISKEDAPSRKPLWIVVTAVICLFVVIAWIVGWL
jgi:predicted nucleic acid-binding Zn ribbon protein